MTTPQQMIEEMVRDFTSIVPRSKSEVRRRLEEYGHLREQEAEARISKLEQVRCDEMVEAQSQANKQ